MVLKENKAGSVYALLEEDICDLIDNRAVE